MEYRAKPGFSAAFLAPDQPFLRLGMSAIITSIIAITTMTAMTAPIIELPVSGEVSAALVTAGASEPARGSISPEPMAADVSASAPSASESIAADAAKIIAYLVFLSIFFDLPFPTLPRRLFSFLFYPRRRRINRALHKKTRHLRLSIDFSPI